MIAGVHTIVFAEDVEAARAFFRDVLGFPAADAGEGWLIFAPPPGELAVHPTAGLTRASGEHELAFMCHDIEATIAELQAKGVEFAGPVTDQGWGLLTRMIVPGAGAIGLYEPRHRSPLAEFS